MALIRQTPSSRQKSALAGIRAKEIWPEQLVLVGLVRAYLLNAPSVQDSEQLANDILEIWRSYSEKKQEGV